VLTVTGQVLFMGLAVPVSARILLHASAVSVEDDVAVLDPVDD